MPKPVNNQSRHILEGIREIAEYFGKHENTIKKWIHKGYLPASKTPDGVWFITKSMINMWIFAGNRAELKKLVEQGNTSVDKEIVKEILEDGRSTDWSTRA